MYTMVPVVYRHEHVSCVPCACFFPVSRSPTYIADGPLATSRTSRSPSPSPRCAHRRRCAPSPPSPFPFPVSFCFSFPSPLLFIFLPLFCRPSSSLFPYPLSGPCFVLLAFYFFRPVLPLLLPALRVRFSFSLLGCLVCRCFCLGRCFW